MNKDKESQIYLRKFGAIATDWELRNLRGLIYKITNLINGNCYIGQTSTTFSERYMGCNWHKYTGNQYLKNAARKYGKNNFKIEIFDYNIQEAPILNQLETMYILLFLCYHPNRRLSKGYNMTYGGDHCEITEETKMKISQTKSKTYFLVDRNGIEYEVKNLRIFCKEHNLSRGAMKLLVSGRHKSSQGFALKGTSINNISRQNNQVYIFENIITREKVITKNCQELGRQLNIPGTTLLRLWDEEILTYQNWKKEGKNIETQYGDFKHIIHLEHDDGRVLKSYQANVIRETGMCRERVKQLATKQIKKFNGWKILN